MGTTKGSDAGQGTLCKEMVRIMDDEWQKRRGFSHTRESPMIECKGVAISVIWEYISLRESVAYKGRGGFGQLL